MAPSNWICRSDFPWKRPKTRARVRRCARSCARYFAAGDSFVLTGPTKSLIPCSENRGHHARATAAMQHGNDQQGPFIGRIGNQIVPHDGEPQRARGEVRPPVALMGERHQRTYGVQDDLTDTAGGWRILLGERFPDVGDVLRSQRMQDKTVRLAHGGVGFFSQAASRWRRLAKKASPSMG